MRTTLDIADDVLLAVKERARRERRTVGKVLSELAREALTHRYRGPGPAELEGFYGFEPLPPRGEAISNELIDRLREEDPETRFRARAAVRSRDEGLRLLDLLAREP